MRPKLRGHRGGFDEEPPRGERSAASRLGMNRHANAGELVVAEYAQASVEPVRGDRRSIIATLKPL